MNCRFAIGTALLVALSPINIVQLSSSAQILPAITNDSDRTLVHSLIKTTLIALNHANMTGNYTVFRDLGSSTFQRNHTAAQLSDNFRDLRQFSVDFGAIVEYEPEFLQPPIINEQGQMHLKGFFAASNTLLLHFDIVFESKEGEWLMSAVGMEFLPVQGSR